jgi:hypothetical protein
METIRTGKYHISDLDNLQELQPLEFANKTILKRLNYLIGFIKEKKPEILQNFAAKLNIRFNKLLKKTYINKENSQDINIGRDFIHLKVYPDLIYNSLNYFLQLLNIDSKKDWTKDKFKVPNINYIQSFLYHRYYNALILTEILERNQGIQLFKDYIDSYVKSLSSEGTKYETLEEFREARIPKKGSPPNIGWVIVQGIIENGKFPQRKDTCMWDDAVKELPDIELRYLVCCYGDFQSYNNLNDNFILTMEHTVVKGDPYCSCLLHDIRINDDLTHPPKEFFDNMWPLDRD